MAAAAERRIVDFNSQWLANAAWAFAMMGQRDATLLEVARVAEWHIGDFDAENLSKMDDVCDSRPVEGRAICSVGEDSGKVHGRF